MLIAGIQTAFNKRINAAIYSSSKFFGYVRERGGTVALEAMDAPPVRWAIPRRTCC